jgi:thiosulfate/3-mercaptopyruvate sulfurtransferase
MKLSMKLSKKSIATSIFLVGVIVILPLTIHAFHPFTMLSNSRNSILPNSTIGAVRVTSEQLSSQWIVSPVEAKYLIEQGAIVLDGRARNVQVRGMVQGAIAVTWQQFSEPKLPDRGHLLRDKTLLNQRLRAVGIFMHQPVVVIGDPLNGWGEEGRIVWMLRTLGHNQAVFVDGGYPALAKMGLPITRQVTRKAAMPGDFTLQRKSDWDITREELRSVFDKGILTIIDAREPREFRGATPYGEKRGGHIPGAISLHYQELLDGEGKLLSREKILALLRDRNISPDAMIVSYCTGGVRSGWLTAVLADLGFRTKNYAGSMWEWSSSPSDHFPLISHRQHLLINGVLSKTFGLILRWAPH